MFMHVLGLANARYKNWKKGERKKRRKRGQGEEEEEGEDEEDEGRGRGGGGGRGSKNSSQGKVQATSQTTTTTTSTRHAGRPADCLTKLSSCQLSANKCPRSQVVGPTFPIGVQDMHGIHGWPGHQGWHLELGCDGCGSGHAGAPANLFFVMSWYAVAMVVARKTFVTWFWLPSCPWWSKGVKFAGPLGWCKMDINEPPEGPNTTWHQFYDSQYESCWETKLRDLTWTHQAPAFHLYLQVKYFDLCPMKRHKRDQRAMKSYSIFSEGTISPWWSFLRGSPPLCCGYYVLLAIAMFSNNLWTYIYIYNIIYIYIYNIANDFPIWKTVESFSFVTRSGSVFWVCRFRRWSEWRFDFLWGFSSTRLTNKGCCQKQQLGKLLSNNLDILATNCDFNQIAYRPILWLNHHGGSQILLKKSGLKNPKWGSKQ